MITAVLKGGLGNIMFQVAATYALALDNGDEAVFVHQEKNIYGIPSMNHSGGILSNVKFDNMWNLRPTSIYREKVFNFNKIPYRPGAVLDGYFQSEKYFSHRIALRSSSDLPLLPYLNLLKTI